MPDVQCTLPMYNGNVHWHRQCTLPMPVTKTGSQVVAEIATADYLVISDCCWIASPAVFEILGSKRTKVTNLTGSHDVIGHVIISFPIGH